MEVVRHQLTHTVDHLLVRRRQRGHQRGDLEVAVALLVVTVLSGAELAGCRRRGSRPPRDQVAEGEALGDETAVRMADHDDLIVTEEPRKAASSASCSIVIVSSAGRLERPLPR